MGMGSERVGKQVGKRVYTVGGGESTKPHIL